MKLLEQYSTHQEIYDKGYRFNPEDEIFFTDNTKKFKHPEGYEEWKIQPITPDSYLKERLKELGISPKQNSVRIEGKDPVIAPHPVFTNNKFGDIEILQYSLHRKAHLFEKKTTSVGTTWEFCVQKRLNPDYEPFCKGKYDGSDIKNTPFWHPSLIEQFEEGVEVPVLTITEGPFKAWKASMDGIPTVGLNSINHFKDQKTGELHGEIIEFIQKCKTQKVVILWDGDCLNISSKHLKKQEDIAQRPHLFYSYAKTIRTSILKFASKKVKVFFATIKTNEIAGNPKGIDDLLLSKGIPTQAVALDFERIGVMPGFYIKYIDITTEPGIKDMRKFFGLSSVNLFYDLHREQIKNTPFLFYGSLYKIDQGLPVIEVSKDLKQYKLIGTDFYRVVEQPVPTGRKDELVLEQALVPWKSDIIKLKHGKDSTAKIETYTGFTNIPSHTDYQQVINEHWNLYTDVKHEKAEGDFPTIKVLLKNVFREHYDNEMIFDYISILYRFPMQKLPIICLLSEEQGTGKSTFVWLLKNIFKQNMSVVNNADITGEFNSHWTSKLLVACEESIFDKKEAYEKLKSYTTAKTITRNEKNKSQSDIPCMLHFVLCSNHENDFMKVSKFDRRLWVRKVLPFKKKEDLADVNFDMKIEQEIPFFVNFIESRDIRTPQRGEFWFHQTDFQTDAFFNLVSQSEPTIVKDIREALTDSFMKYGGLMRELTADDFRMHFGIKGERSYINKAVQQYLGALRIVNKHGKEYVRQYSFPKEDYSNPMEYQFVKSKGRPFVFRAEMILSQEQLDYVKNYNPLTSFQE